MATGVQQLGASSQARAPIRLLDLPIETISLICENAYYSDLAQLCRVSKTMRGFAAAELYRSLHHTFGVSSPRKHGLHVDDLAGYLETLATSEYSYAGHIKTVFFDTANAAEAGEKACREFSYEHSCGKFLQTLLLAVLKRTTGLESFCWNVRVELSSAVYRTLYKMSHLRNVNVRLQIGPSLHSTSNAAMTTALTMPPVNTMPPPPGHPPHVPQAHHGHHQYPHPTALSLVKKAPIERQVLRATTFSGFTRLNTLSVLDMDTLENVPEIGACINKSSDSLKHLQLSLSDRFARKARKAAVVESASENEITEDDVSDVDDTPPPPLNVDGSENTSGVPALPDTPQSYRAAQEGALARILEFSSSAPPTKELKKAAENVISAADREGLLGIFKSDENQNDEHFIKMLKSILRERPDDSTSGKSEKKIFYEKLDKATFGYLRSRGKSRAPKISKRPSKTVNKAGKPKNSQTIYLPPPTHLSPGQNTIFVPTTIIPKVASSSHSSSEQSSWGNDYSAWGQAPSVTPYQYHLTGKPTPQYPHNPPVGYPGKSFAPALLGEDSTTGELFMKPSSDESRSESGGAATPPAIASGNSSNSANETKEPPQPQTQEIFEDDVDLEHPDDTGDGDNDEDQTFVNDKTSETERAVTADKHELVSSHEMNGVNGNTVPAAAVDEPPTSALSAKAQGKQVLRDAPDGQAPASSREENSAATYLRLSHGLTLESLYIYLLPVKPTVLLRHIDMHSLKDLCLLNVGPQRALWLTLNKLHRQSPLQLSSVYTDDVTQSLLAFLNALPAGQLEELTLLEHGPRGKVSQLASSGKTQVVGCEIYRTVLKKHMKSLRRLVLRNDDDDKWALDNNTVRLIARDGQKLTELGIQCYSELFHTLARALPSLPKLYALQVVFIVHPPTESVPMNPSGQPAGPVYSSGILPKLINNTIIEELRQSITDNLSHCNSEFSLTYVGLAAVNGNVQSSFGLGPPAVVLSRIETDWDIWSDEDEEEDVENDVKATSGGELPILLKARAETGNGKVNGEGSSNGIVTAKKTERQEEKRELIVWTEDNLKMTEVQGLVKMWSKELWAGRL